MIAKFENVSGDALANLLIFIHSEENQGWIPLRTSGLLIVSVKSVTPVNPDGNSDNPLYGITLNIRECLPPAADNRRVDPKYLLRVYQIVGNQGSTSGQSEILACGTQVQTTTENPSLRNEWTEEGKAKRKWGVQGIVIAHHDSHGLCYDVEHRDGSIGCYDPSELEEKK
jgi:hypothetical protein